jgi:hypothetical protein
MRELDLHLVDVNAAALAYCERQFTFMNESLGHECFSPCFEHVDFLRYDGISSTRPLVIFGNPPWVSNPRGATWKNTYADFLDRCLEQAEPLAALHFIVPLSLAFSRDYAALREKFRARDLAVYLSHFDNIPDTLFKAGKPQNQNTNKANSQRCTIISAYTAPEHRLYSSKLHRWSAAGRATLLADTPHFEDVTHHRLGNQFIRPSSPDIARYLHNENVRYSLGDLVSDSGRHTLHIGAVARNYISVRGEAANGTHAFTFSDRNTFYRFLGLIASDVFMEFWRSVGDGFHLTRSNILNFPVSEPLHDLVDDALPKIQSMWRRRKRFEKTKLNSGTVVRSYDFSAAAPRLCAALSQAPTPTGSEES